MKIVYKKYRGGEEITENKTLIIGTFLKFFINNNEELVKIESYEENSLILIHYYRKNDEVESLLVDELSNIIGDIYISDPVIIIENYTYQVTKSYTDGILSGKSRTLFDQYNNIICDEMIDIETDLPIYSRTNKRYYGEGIEAAEGIEDFDFEYNDDGSLEEVYRRNLDDEWGNGELYSAEEFVELIEGFSENINFNYFLSASFEP